MQLETGNPGVTPVTTTYVGAYSPGMAGLRGCAGPANRCRHDQSPRYPGIAVSGHEEQMPQSSGPILMAVQLVASPHAPHAPTTDMHPTHTDVFAVTNKKH